MVWVMKQEDTPRLHHCGLQLLQQDKQKCVHLTSMRSRHIRGTAIRLIYIVLGLLHPSVPPRAWKRKPEVQNVAFNEWWNLLNQKNVMQHSNSTCTAAATLLSERVHVSPPSFHAVFRSRTVDNNRNCRIAVPRWRYGKLLYVRTYTVDRSSILFNSYFFVSRHIIQFSLKRCENDKTTKAMNERLSNQGHGHVDCRWKCPRQALLIVFLVSKMVGNFSQKFPDFAGGSLLVCRSPSLQILKQIMCLRSIFFSGLAQGLQAQPSSQMLKCEDKRLSWRSLTNISMIQPSTPPRTLVDPLVTFIDVLGEAVKAAGVLLTSKPKQEEALTWSHKWETNSWSDSHSGRRCLGYFGKPSGLIEV